MFSASCTVSAGLSGVAAPEVLARAAHLRELRHVGVAQHQADIRVRNQPPLRVDDIGVAALADLDLRDHVPDQLEIDLGDAHAGVAPRPGDGQGHVRLGFTAEIDRAVIDLAGDRFSELRVAREIGAACDDVHGEPRHPQPLFAGGVELGELGDGGNLAQQPQGVETALLD